ncbi:sensor histidine kinase [Embleya sp. AB8]|uniref:sensor histidine kinase n=1 Tax=Embleya sp. AB8 TaxID=3156304 RepID=UPI003C74299E
MSDRGPRPLVVRRLRPGHWPALDAILAVVMAGGWIGVGAAEHRPWLGTAAMAAIWLSVAVRRWWPLPVLGTMLVGALLAAASGWPESYFVLGFALFSAAAQEPARQAIAGLCLALPVVVVTVWLPADSRRWWENAIEIVFGCSVVVLTWVCGRAIRETRALARLAARQSAARAVADERLRIARDLHDVVAHSMSVITLRAGVAALIAESRPEEARAALRLVERTGRDALVEMRHLLCALRAGPDAERPGAAPAPGLRDLPELAAGAGVFVELRMPPEVALPEGVELTVYRIVQEALTNVVKHASAASCVVTVCAPAPGVVDVEVLDDGPGRAAQTAGGTGYGLLGMAERVRPYGGVLHAGPRPGGGFRVHARLSHGVVGSR